MPPATPDDMEGGRGLGRGPETPGLARTESRNGQKEVTNGRKPGVQAGGDVVRRPRCGEGEKLAVPGMRCARHYHGPIDLRLAARRDCMALTSSRQCAPSPLGSVGDNAISWSEGRSISIHNSGIRNAPTRLRGATMQWGPTSSLHSLARGPCVDPFALL